MSGFLALLKRDLTLAAARGIGARHGARLLSSSSSRMLPLGLGPDLKLLSRIAPGVLWIALLLAALLSLPRMFEADHEDGSLEVMATAPLPLELAVGGQGAGALDLDRNPAGAAGAGARASCSTSTRRSYRPSSRPCWPERRPISFLGSIGAALTLRSRRGGLLLALLVLPLYVPTLIFGISAMGSPALGPGGFRRPHS